VKYIAKSAAKNINSDASQTIVPTATRFGRLALLTVPAYVVMGEIIPEIERNTFIESVRASGIFG
jgi:hypothetical protein